MSHLLVLGCVVVSASWALKPVCSFHPDHKLTAPLKVVVVPKLSFIQTNIFYRTVLKTESTNIFFRVYYRCLNWHWHNTLPQTAATVLSLLLFTREQRKMRENWFKLKHCGIGLNTCVRWNRSGFLKWYSKQSLHFGNKDNCSCSQTRFMIIIS